MSLPPASGRLLVATPGLLDPNFFRSVVLICQHDSDQGTVGLVLNRPTDVRVGNVLPQIAESRDERLWIGGPVQKQSLWVLHRRADLETGTAAVMDGVFCTCDPKVVGTLLRTNAPDREGQIFRLYAGYAGWTAGQLEAELEERAWTVVPTGVETLFDAGNQRMWHDMTLRSLLVPDPSPDLIKNAWLN